MAKESSYEELKERVRELEKEIAKHNRTEEALRENEHRLNTVLDTIQAGVVVIDPETRIIVGVNAAAAKIVGVSEQKILRSLCHHNYICPAEEGQCPILDLGQNFDNTEQVLLTAHGGKIPILKTVVPVILAGRKHLLESFVDISDQKRAEEELRKTNEELKHFVNVVSHDLKNPIMSIQGFSFLLLKKYKGTLDEKALSYLQHIEANASRMGALVSDLLDLSRLGSVDSSFGDVRSIEIVTKVTSDLQDRLRKRGIDLVVVNDVPTIHCDGKRIYQVFENLLVNAIKFMGDAKDPKIEIGYQDNGDVHQFYVKDNGIGIDPKHHRKVFEMFRRLEQTEDQEGTGLGLAIVDRIVKNHNGKVWVESERGEGATFYFILPK
ncbi:MAG: PAS domain S-box protein [Deltaproteobacteria bacterium]|nr:PAS domain S-box protein [Deltaproteobacteria bacterium]